MNMMGIISDVEVSDMATKAMERGLSSFKYAYFSDKTLEERARGISIHVFNWIDLAILFLNITLI